MKKLLPFVFSIVAATALAQAPEAFSYQAVARDAGGDPLANTTVGVRFQLHQSTAVGAVVYAETHSPTTNELGLFSVEVGNGTPTTGTFEAIDWSAGPYFLEVGLDPAGGSSYTSVGTQQLLSVPYALHANTVSEVEAASLFGSGNLLAPDLSCIGVSGSLGIGPYPTSVAVLGNYAYVVDGDSEDLKVINVSNPGMPTLAGSLGIGSEPQSVAVSGNYAYVVDHLSDDLKVIDISNPSMPTLTGSLGLGSFPFSVAVSGNYAYVVDSGSDDLKVINVSNPGMPTLAGSLGLGASPQCVAVSGNYAYVVDVGSDDLKVINISNPGMPTLTGSLGLGSSPRFVAVSGNFAYVVDVGSSDLKVIDTSDPAMPILAGSLGLVTPPRSVAVSGNYAYVVDFGSDELKVIDTSNPGMPIMAGSLGLGSDPTSVVVSGNYAYVVDVDLAALRVIELFCNNEAQPMSYNPVSGEFSTADEADPQVGDITTGYVPRWSGTELVTGSVFDNGNVGIGTSAPTRRFQVHDSNGGTIRPAVKIKVNNCGSPCGQPETTQAFTLQNQNGTAGNVVGIGFADSDADETPSAWLGTRLANKTLHYGDLLFHTRGGGGFGERMRITSIGNVGIGTGNPVNRLDVEGGMAVGQTYSGSHTAPTNGAIIEGNVGIATTNPGAELEVNGYTKLGSDAPAIKVKEFTGTTPSTEGDFTSITTGIPRDKVISVDIWVAGIAPTWSPPNRSGPNYFSYFVTDSSIFIETVTGISGNMLNKAVRMIVTYKE